MNNRSNWQDFLKTVAIVAMVIDHLGLYFFPYDVIFRVIGRLAMPLFCFFAGYNFKGKPHNDILAYGLLMYSYSTLLYGFIGANILIPIYLGYWYIYIFKNSLGSFYSSYMHVIVLGALAPLTFSVMDYGTLSIAIMILGYCAARNLVDIKLTAGLSLILSLYHTIAVFGLSMFYMSIELVLFVGMYYLMIKYDLRKSIKIDLNILSRNSLIIYFVHLLIIQCTCLILIYNY